ncbi:RNA methyltransferase [Fulvimarina sp. 2208YS6-2-32]|uniref:tRNA (cytidine/uridine-2'-O-)-methyltransferase TrmJ n=1 Tax=Fulvimarina uroteuthidis TaxID=3098149 RepID=A0ABU5I4P5_9HYPH|nr:RNA methyltransferase [Fulvimarina sp. 2208YS6-2-32]MDY8109703.1 RNA methyltransferase [Fulvimarina sp. 2208YS6-2-32]
MSQISETTTPPGPPAIILVEPQMGENIGMVARAMANFGLTDLRLVRPRDGWPNERARATASRADHVLDSARVFDRLEDALAGLSLVYATTARARDSYKPVRGPQEAAERLVAHATTGAKAGVMFGREKYGLENDEIGRADEIVTFPVNPDFASLNIAQAVLLVSYAFRTAADPSHAPRFSAPPTQQADKADLFRLFDHLEGALDKRNYFFPPHKREALLQNLRTMLTKAHFSEQEVRTLRGVIRSLERPVDAGEGENEGEGRPA